MTDFGAVPSNIAAGIVIDSDYDELLTPVVTASATLVDITGATFDITVPTGLTGRVFAEMTFQASSDGAGGARVGAWAISVNSVDGTELQRNLSGTSDIGIGSVRTRSAVLTAGTYTVVGRQRKVSGSGNISTDVAQLSAFVILE